MPSRIRVLLWLLVIVALPVFASDIVWVEDSLPAGAVPSGANEGWTWVNQNPTPFSGALAHQSVVFSGLHQHFFTGATTQITPVAGERLFSYVYLDPMQPPTQVMLQWNDGTWEHRAYWGASQLPWGVEGTVSRRYMGPLPPTGKWVRLEVDASLVGLVNRPLNGMAFTLYNGKATWDKAGKVDNNQVGPVVMNLLAHPNGSKNANFRVQATGFSAASVANGYRVYGTAGYQQLRWNSTGTAIDNLYHGTTSFPDFLTLDDRTDCAHTKDPRLWDARCGTDVVGLFSKNISCPGGLVACEDNDRWNASPGTYNLTTFPALGIWPRSDDFGTTGYTPILDQTKINSVALQPADTNCGKPAGDFIWVADLLPRQATTSVLNDQWTWVATSSVSATAPFAGSSSHQSSIFAARHEHTFANATQPLVVNAGDVLITYIFIDPANPVREVMLQWNGGGNWEHRAYWGENLINLGTNGTNSRRFKGALPAAGQWVRLEVPASEVGLANTTVTGMTYTLYGGRATWDHSGKWVPATITGQCPPKTGRAQLAPTFHAYNPDDYATGAANSKAVQVTYADGSTRWFMAFNGMIKHMRVSYGANPKKNDSNWGRTGADNWRVLWATSSNGVTWTVHPQVLFRSTLERDFEWTGLLMTDMTIDNGYFYVVFQDLVKPHSYLARARIDPANSTSNPGYVAAEGWSIAALPLVGGQYTWKPITPLGGQFNFDAYGAAPVMPARVNTGGGFVKQASIARIYKSTAPGAASKIFGVTNDASIVQLWSTTDLSRPFVYESDVVLDPSIDIGGNGWEFGFTHYPDNTSSTPRIVGVGFQVWVVEQTMDAWTIVSRRDATLTNY